MSDYDPESLSQHVRDALAWRQERDLKIYNLDYIEEYWLGNSPRTFVSGINHEILREVAGFKTWLKVLIDDPAIASMPLKYTHDGEEITVKDMCQIMLASTETIRKILMVSKKYAEIKFNNDSGE